MYHQINNSRKRGYSGLNRIANYCNKKQPNNLLNCVFGESNNVVNNNIINGKCCIGDVLLVNYSVILYIIDDGIVSVHKTKTDNNGQFSITININNISDYAIFYFSVFYMKIKLINIVSKSTVTNNYIITINSITTISNIYAFNNFLSNDGTLNGTEYEYSSCLTMANNISTYNGYYSTVISSNPNANETHIFRMLGNIENIIYGCVRDKTDVILNLFLTYTDINNIGLSNMNTFIALYNMCNYPANNVSNIFNLSHFYIYNQNYLSEDVLPNSFIIAIKFNNSGNTDINFTFGGPGNMIIDKEDKIWITNNVVQGTIYSSNYVIILNKDGTPYKLSPIDVGYTMGSGFGITINSSKTIITIGNLGWGGVDPTYPITNITYNGDILPASNYSDILNYVQGVTYDRNDNLWVCSYGNSRIALFYKNNPNNFDYYQLDTDLTPFCIKQDKLDDDIVSSCGSNVVKVRIGANGLEEVFNTQIDGATKLLGLDLDYNDNIYLASSSYNSIVKLNSSGELLQNISNNSIFDPWSCTVNNNTLFITNFGCSEVTNKYNNIYGINGYYSVGCCDLSGNMISPDNGYLIQSGGDPVLLSNGDNLFINDTVTCYYPLMRQTSCLFDRFGNLWVTNNWKPPFIVDALNNPGGDGMVVILGLSK
jgi:sugar lactone lactonase YvrE